MAGLPLSDAAIELDPLLKQPDAESEVPAYSVPKGITGRLYVSHSLSAWNSRVFEFGSVLYLAAIYPDTLLPMSIYALARGFAAIILAPAIGQYIDTGNRLRVVRVSIRMHLRVPFA
jgi:solute carrier family 40 (iron-regulated transporter), member 1